MGLLKYCSIIQIAEKVSSLGLQNEPQNILIILENFSSSYVE
jgi:hypothetical protein